MTVSERFRKLMWKEGVLWLALCIYFVYMLTSIIRFPIFQTENPIYVKQPLEMSAGWEFVWDTPVVENGQPLTGTLPPETGWQPLARPVNPPDREDKRYVWFRVPLPNEMWDAPTVFLEATDLAYVAYVDGEVVHRWSEMAMDSRKKFDPWTWSMISLPPDYQGKHLYLLMYSDLPKIGMTGVPRIGSKDSFVATLFEHSLWRILVGGLCVFLGLVAFSLFLFKPTQRPLLSYAVFSIATGLINLFDHYVAYVFGLHQNQNFVVPGMLIAPVALILYLRQVFQMGQSKLVNFVLWVNCGVMAYTLYRFQFQLDTLPYLFGPFQIAVFLSVSVIFIKVLPLAVKGNFDAKLMFGGISIWLLWIIFDILTALSILPWSLVRSNYWGLLFFNVSLMVILGRRFGAVHNQLQEFSQALTRTNRRLHSVLEITQKMSATREIPEVVEFTLASLAAELCPNDSTVQARVEINGEDPITFRYEKSHHAEERDDDDDESRPAARRNQSVKISGGQLSAALSSGEKSWGKFVLEGLPIENLETDDVEFLTTVLQSLALAFDNIMVTREKIRAELKVTEARLEELGGVAVYLGDRVANPMAILSLSAEEIAQLATEAQQPGVDQEISGHCTRMVSAIQRMKDEFQILAKYKTYAKSNVLDSGFPDVG